MKINKLIILSLFFRCSGLLSFPTRIFEKIYTIVSKKEYKNIFKTEFNAVDNTKTSIFDKQYAQFASAGLTFEGTRNLRYYLSIKNLLINTKPKTIFLMGAGKGSGTIPLIIETLLDDNSNDEIIIYYNDVIEENFTIFINRLLDAFSGKMDGKKIVVKKCIGDVFNKEFIEDFKKKHGCPDIIIEECLLHFTTENSCSSFFSLAHEVVMDEYSYALNSAKQKEIMDEYKTYKNEHVASNCLVKLVSCMGSNNISLYSNNIYILPNTIMIAPNSEGDNNIFRDYATTRLLRNLKEIWDKLDKNATKNDYLKTLRKLITQNHDDYNEMLAPTRLLPTDLFTEESLKSLIDNGYKKVKIEIHCNPNNHNGIHNYDDYLYDYSKEIVLDLSTKSKEVLLKELTADTPLEIIFSSLKDPEEMKNFLNNLCEERYFASIGYTISK